MKSAVLLGFHIWLLGQALCHARIGETLEQCEARWGMPVMGNLKLDIFPDGTFSRFFVKNNFEIAAVFMNGVCGAEYIQRHDRSELTQDQLSILVHSESDDLTWNPGQGQHLTKVRSDGRVAYSLKDMRGVAFYSREYAIAQRMKNGAKDQTALRSF